ILRLPHHGRHRHPHADRRHRRADHDALERPPVALGRLSAPVPVDVAARLHRRDRRLGGDRGRPSAVDRLRTDAHGGFGVAVAHRHRRRHLARVLRDRLSDHVPDRHRLHGRAGAARADRGRGDGPDRERPSRAAVRARQHAGRRIGETTMVLDLVPIWTFLVALAVFYYVVFDGFDLGVGILSGFARNEDDRALIMASIAPIWDGNETWLIFGGLGLLTAFPLAFAIIIPAVYFPIVIMLLALVFRGVAFEFRFKRPALRRFWDRAFAVGSALATFAQGIVLGAFIQGFKIDGRVFAGTSFDWVTPFALLTGVALMFGYALLGAGWLILKTEGALQRWARRCGRVCLIGVGIAIVGVSIWTPLAHPDIAQRWFSWPNIGFLSIVPIVTAVLAWIEWRSLAREH